MVSRLAAAAAVVVPLGVALAPAADPWPWLPSIVAATFALVVLILRPHAWTMVVLGLAITVLATHLASRSRNLMEVTATLAGPASVPPGPLATDSWPRFDLTQSPMPETPPEYVAVRGFLRTEWVLDEYRLAAEERPDQNAPPDAVLVPLADTADAVIRVQGPLVVARVPAPVTPSHSIQTVRGKVEPLPTELLATLLQAGGAPFEPSATGIIIDTFATPKRRDAWILAALTILCAGLGLTCLGIAAHTPRASAS